MIVPAVRRPRNTVELMVADLATRPGEWVEVARYPASRRRSAYSRGSQACKRHPGLQYGVSADPQAEAILYFRHAPPGTVVYDGHNTDTERHQP